MRIAVGKLTADTEHARSPLWKLLYVLEKFLYGRTACGTLHRMISLQVKQCTHALAQTVLRIDPTPSRNHFIVSLVLRTRILLPARRKL